MLKTRLVMSAIVMCLLNGVIYADSLKGGGRGGNVGQTDGVSVLNQVHQQGDWYGRWSNDIINPLNPMAKLNNALAWGGGLRFEVTARSQISVVFSTVFSNAGTNISYRAYKVGATAPKFKILQAETQGQHTIDISQEFPLVQGGNYIVELFKNTESYNSVITLDDIKASSAESIMTMQHARLFEFVGDSITTGYNVLNGSEIQCSNSIDCEDANLSYAADLSRLFGARYSIVARSGIGVAPDGYQLFQKPMAYFYEKAQYPVSEKPASVSTWDFSTSSPKMIFMALGTNDGSASVNGIFSYELPDQAKNDFESDYSDLIVKVRQKNPNACIVLLSTITPVTPNVVSQSIQEVANKTKDDKLRYISVEGVLPNQSDYVGDWTHPTVAGHEKLANYIYQQLNNSENKSFTDACLAT
ncbi:SGNH/GDSL hydrolase family protein [Cysteiniphilum litorale]|uniref:SGNH/GDSL hydrolase family protein n=1 Tax=Cysteiniphilum litorale TaxID=2056700 RepID=UPI003F8848B8